MENHELYSKKLRKIAKEQEGELRVIAGKWRGKKISFAALEGLRPTPDRLRETLFNWLMNKTAHSICLDLFAGSGMLGIEALSRGAKEVIFIEKNPLIASHINKQLSLLQPVQATVIISDAVTWVKSLTDRSFDIVFVDPPFISAYLPILTALIECVAFFNSKIYIESAEDQSALCTTLGFEILKQTKVGHVYGLLIQKKDRQ